MDRRARRVDGHASHNSPLQGRYSVAQGPKPFPEQHVLFQAIAPAASRDHLLLKRGKIELWCPAEHDVQRLVGNGVRVHKNELMQCAERRLKRACISNAVEPSLLIERGRGHRGLPHSTNRGPILRSKPNLNNTLHRSGMSLRGTSATWRCPRAKAAFYP